MAVCVGTQTYLGFEINTRLRTIRIPDDKWHRLKWRIIDALRYGTRTQSGHGKCDVRYIDELLRVLPYFAPFFPPSLVPELFVGCSSVMRTEEERQVGGVSVYHVYGSREQRGSREMRELRGALEVAYRDVRQQIGWDEYIRGAGAGRRVERDREWGYQT